MDSATSTLSKQFSSGKGRRQTRLVPRTAQFPLVGQSVLTSIAAVVFSLQPLYARAVGELTTDGSTLSIQRGTAAGDTFGPDLGVGSVLADNFKGAATLRIPIRVPDGTNSIQPNLVLRYSSHDVGKASWVGAGWSLDFGEITRSLKEGVPTFDNSLDTFFLNGRELVNDQPDGSGSWHSRRESFLRIVATANGWEVRSKSGTFTRYGESQGVASDNCTVRNPTAGLLNPSSSWLLCERVDLHGNTMRVTYDRSDAGSAYIARIEYGTTSDLNRVVEFNLEPRPDTTVHYLSGFARRMSMRLASIDVTAAGDLIRRYEFYYGSPSSDTGRSLLREVREFGSDGNSMNPTAPRITTFKYRSNVEDGTEAWLTDSRWALPLGVHFVRDDEHQTGGGLRIADLNGDGLSDLLREVKANAHDNENDGLSGSYINNGAGFDPRSDQVRLPMAPGSPLRRQAFSSTFQEEADPWGTLLVDLNRDGRVDMLHMSHLALVEDVAWGIWTFHHRAHNTPSGWSDRYSDWGPATLNELVLPGQFKGFDFLYGFQFSSFVLQSGFLQFQDGRTVLAELNGDGRPDFLTHFVWADEADGPGSTERSFVLNTGDLGDGFGPYRTDRFQICTSATLDCELRSATVRYKSESIPVGFGVSIPHIGKVSRMGKRLIDLNGDGLDDFVVAYQRQPTAGLPQTDWLHVYINDGNEFSGDDRWNLPVFVDVENVDGRTEDQGVRFTDLNGDGLPDLIKGREGQPIRAWLNSGDPDSPWIELGASHGWQLPPGMEFVSSTEGRDRGVRIVDLDGNGMVDLLRVAEGQPQQVFLNAGSTPDLLTQVTNHFGGVTSVSYSPSTHLDNTKGDGTPGLPRVLQVVDEITTDDGIGPPATMLFTYFGGLYDAGRREFRGFRQVDTQDASGRLTRRFFFQDDARSGLIEKSEVLLGGDLWRQVITEYTPDSDGAPFASLPAAVDTIEWDGSPTAPNPRRTRTSFSYDEFGNVSTVTEWGDWNDSIGDINPDDTRTTSTEFIANNAIYLVDRRARERVYDGTLPGSAIVRETEFYYDNHNGLFDTPAQGDLTRRVQRLDVPGRPNPTTTFQYDGFGNLEVSVNPRANAGEISTSAGSTTATYDSVFHTFPVSVTNGLGHETQFEYATGVDCQNAAGSIPEIDPHYPAGAGLAQVERSPNALAAGANLVRCYDVFGRPVYIRSPLGLASTVFHYFDTPGLTAVDRSEAVSSTANRNTTTSYDGFGRAIRVETEGPQGGTIIAERKFDQVGRLKETLNPYFLGDPSQPTSFQYDPLDRLVRTTLPGTGRTSTITHDRGIVTLTDANNRVIERTLDPFGNIVQVREIGPPDGPYITRYEYGPFDDLRKVTDHYGNETIIAYDRLGRRTSLDDPDTGFTTFNYNANGMLVERVNALGSVNWDYDALDRKEAQHLGGAAGSDVSWKYDTAANGVGLLAERYDRSEPYRVETYDLLGRATSERYGPRPGISHTFDTIYDLLGQISSKRYPAGRTVEWVRDSRGYLSGVRTGQDYYADQIEWDARGRVVHWETNGGVATTTAFDPISGRLDEVRIQTATALYEHVRYEFDPGDRLTAVTDFRDTSKNQSFGYDELSRLRLATGPYHTALERRTWYFQYDAIGNITCLNSENPASCAGTFHTSFGFAVMGPGTVRPHAPTSANSSSLFFSLNYDATGNLKTWNAAGWQYSYNTLGQLRTATQYGFEDAKLTYDGTGRLAKVLDRSVTPWVTRLLLTDDFEWDSTNKVGRVLITLGSLKIAAHDEAYDPQPPRSSCGGGFELIALLPLIMLIRARKARASSLLNSAVAIVSALAFQVAMIGVPATARAAVIPGVVYYHADHIGSSVLVTDSLGNIVERQVYRPYGEAVPTAGGSTEAPEIGFTNQRYVKALGIYDYGARWYRPEFGRFLQPDSVVPRASDPQSLNRYSYVRNSPTNRIDPEGNIDIGREVGGFVGSVFGDEEVGQTFGSFAGGFVPVVGELADLDVILDETAEVSQKAIAVVSLAISVVTAGTSPNFGGAAAGVIRKADEVLSTGGKPAQAASAAATNGGRTVIGKLDDIGAGKLRSGENSLLKHLDGDLGSPRANWGRNSSVLRTEVRKGVPIRDATVNPNTGALINDTGFVRAERNLLRNQGWTYNPGTTLWSPPR